MLEVLASQAAAAGAGSPPPGVDPAGLLALAHARGLPPSLPGGQLPFGGALPPPGVSMPPLPPLPGMLPGMSMDPFAVGAAAPPATN